MDLSFPGFRNGGDHLGENPICVWQVVSVHPDSVKNTLDYLNHLGRTPHFIWNPVQGGIVQCLSLSVAGRLFSPRVNQGGMPCIQVAILGTRETPFTDTPLEGSENLLGTIERQGVPPVWPKGPPSLYVASSRAFEGVIDAGHYSIDQLDPSFPGTGPIDIRKLSYD